MFHQNYIIMKAMTLCDKITGKVIGTVLLKADTDFLEVSKAWHHYQKTNNSNLKEKADIYDFVSKGNWEMCEVLELIYFPHYD